MRGSTVVVTAIAMALDPWPGELDAASMPPEWFLVFRDGDQRKAVSADGTITIELKSDPRPSYDADTARLLGLGSADRPQFALSPDRRRMAYLGKVANGRATPHPFHGQVCVCNVDGSVARTLVNGPANRQSLSWSPDGAQIAFDEDTPTNGDPNPAVPQPQSLRQVHVIDAATGIVRRTIAGTSSISRPRFTPKGNLLYHQLCDRQGKLALNDLYFQKIGPTPDDEHRLSRTLVKREFLIGAALSPDESKLAVTLLGLLAVRPLDGASDEVWTVEDVGKQLGIDLSTAFGEPVWRPDGRAVACRCVVIGGRRVANAAEVAARPGEEQIVVFPLGGKAQAFALPPQWVLEGWTMEVERWRR